MVEVEVWVEDIILKEHKEQKEKEKKLREEILKNPEKYMKD